EPRRRAKGGAAKDDRGGPGQAGQEGGRDPHPAAEGLGRQDQRLVRGGPPVGAGNNAGGLRRGQGQSGADGGGAQAISGEVAGGISSEAPDHRDPRTTDRLREGGGRPKGC